MSAVRIYGCSDDLIEVSGILGADGASRPDATDGEWDVYSDKEKLVGPWSITAPDGESGLHVYGAFVGGCWAFMVAQVDEDTPLPSWPVRVVASSDCSYSTELQIDAPVGSRWADARVREAEGNDG